MRGISQFFFAMYIAKPMLPIIQKRGLDVQLLEKAHVVAARSKYLRGIQEARLAGKKVVYLDETWINGCDGSGRKEWLDSKGEGRNRQQAKGGRWVVVDAGGEDGFVEGALRMWRTDGTKSDYHHEMNGEEFKKWFKDVLEKLPQDTVVVMDNASYHSVQTEESRSPTVSWTVKKMKEWLNKQS